MSLKHTAALLAASASLITASTALASGRSNIPFGNGSGGGAQTGNQSGSGGGGSSTAPQGGGGGSTVTRSCAISVSSTAGAVAGNPGTVQAFVESPFAVPVGCPTGSHWIIQYVNAGTGVVEFQDSGTTGLNESGGGNQGFTLGTSGTEVFIPASFNTTYLVRMLVEDVNDNVITEQDQTVTTPAAS
jgi:hypothetical protein